jgi:hypothetical protein
MPKLRDLAQIIRSKNAGPFELTLDVIFESKQDYERVKEQNVLSKERIQSLYGSEVLSCFFFDNALAFKASLARKVSSGTVGDSDVFGAQQHAPLLDLNVE